MLETGADHFFRGAVEFLDQFCAGQRVQLLRGSHGVYLVKSKVRPEAPALKVAF